MTDGASSPIKLSLDKREILFMHYLQRRDLSIGIENQDPKAILVIESLAVRFHSRRSTPTGVDADPQTTVVYPGGALSIAPTKRDYCTVQVRPNLLFLKGTNYFDIAITYRLCTESIGAPQSFIGEGWFVIVNPVPLSFGKVFISYKEPEDRRLADLLFEFAKDAGFEPYMAPPDLKTGSRIWGKKIPAAIKDSKFVFVIWTTNTPKGPGVKREIRIARKNGIELVPLLESKARAPGLFGHDVEYTRFDADDPTLMFAEVVAARRSM
ncbi:MAG: toll/interleukin-1 receptor domain-containing protein [Terriglobales bacterium]